VQIPDHIEGFQWDRGNRDKNWEGHGVAWWECEQVFFNYPLFTYPDLKHSDKEQRHYALGKTDASRLLFLVFTTRGAHIRIISAREMNRKERKVYLEKT
jgi:uncharacterized DUF497 family protein